MGEGTCERCQSNPPSYRMMRSWAVFDSPVRDALHAMKYRRNLALGEALAAHMAEFFRVLDWRVDVFIPVPLGKDRLKERGYNQVELVAGPLAYETGLKYAPRALRKIRDTRSQVGLNFSQRRENVHNAYQADPEVVRRKSVALMDDVTTTGSTILACTDALLSAGAREVLAITIARALSHHDPTRA